MLRRTFKVVKYGAVAGTIVGTGYLYTKFQPIKIVWDLDNTLIHTIKVDKGSNNSLIKPDFKMGCKDETKERYGYVRPFAYYSLKFFSLLTKDQYIFTAATKDYAKDVMEGANIDKFVKSVITREDVIVKPGPIIAYYCDELKDSTKDDVLHKTATEKYESLSLGSKQLKTIKTSGKDIDLFNEYEKRDSRMILVDDKKEAHIGHENQGILIPKFFADKNYSDCKLLKVSWIVLKCFFSDNVSDVIRKSNYYVK